MFDCILDSPLKLHEKNEEKQAFLLIHANTLLLFCLLWLFNTFVSTVSAVYFEKFLLIKFLLSYSVFARKHFILWVKESAWIYFDQSRNTITRTECKIVIIESSERDYLSRCIAEPCFYFWTNFTSISWNSVVEFGLLLGYRNVVGNLGTSKNLTVQTQQ